MADFIIEVRNAIYIEDGIGIDCELNHPKFSWVPYTARPDDPAVYGAEIYAAAVALGPSPYVAPPPPPDPPEPTPAEKEAEVQTITEEILTSNDHLMALAQATVDLRMGDITGLSRAQVAVAFRDRVIYYLRQQRGI